VSNVSNHSDVLASSVYVQCTAQAMVAAATLAMLAAPVGATRGWVDVTVFGASPLGLSDSSESTRRALANLSATGGGTLYFPPGRFAFLFQVAITSYSIKVLGAVQSLLRASGKAPRLWRLLSSASLRQLHVL
jgi:polygalacturonase